jgi:hypothetical protein
MADLTPEPPAPIPPPPQPTRSVPVRWQRRAEPRLLITIAAAGCALVVGGAILIGGDGLGPDGVGGDSGSKAPGLIMMAAVVAAGYALLGRFREGPLATTGSIAVAAGVPPLLFFATFDAESGTPFDLEAILVLSTGIFLVTWLVGPGRSRPIFLGLAALGAWLSVLEIVEDAASAPLQVVWFVFLPFGADSGPDFGNIGFISFLFGAAYLLLARAWDRRGWTGAATPLTAVGLASIALGVGFLSDDLNAGGTGMLATIVGALLVAHGADVGRRATTWIGGGGVVIGVATVVADLTEDPTLGGLLLMTLGGAVVLVAQSLRGTIDEPPEVPTAVDVPSEF